jgi:hypothetical protein
MPRVIRRSWVVAWAGVAWLALLATATARAQGGCHSDLLSFIGYALIPVTLALAAGAAWALRGNSKIIFIVAVLAIGVFNFFAYAILAGNHGCFE